MKNKISLNTKLFKKVYLIRKAEEVIVEHYDSDIMKTPMHMSMGEEGIVSGICEALSQRGLFFGTYRSHGLYLATTGDTDGFFAEMCGKATGIIKGKGGSMHLSSPQDNFLATSAVVATTIPLAVGAAFSSVVKKSKKISVVFFGDGAVDEGAFWESVNLACLMKLPVLFVCEDNGYAVHTPPSKRHGYKSILKLVSGFDMSSMSSESTDAEVIYELTQKSAELISKYSRPAFIYLKYYRYLEHVGTHNDFDAGYRSEKEFKSWLKVDPVIILEKKLKGLGLAENVLENIKKKIDLKVEGSFQRAMKAPFSPTSEITKNIFHEK